MFKGAFRMTAIGENKTVFTEDLKNSSSEEFIKISKLVCQTVSTFCFIVISICFMVTMISTTDW